MPRQGKLTHMGMFSNYWFHMFLSVLGMRPLMYSEQQAERSGVGWQRVGHHISYARSNGFHRNPLLHVETAYYTLERQLEFSYENDICYFAHCYPYTFTDLREHIDLLLSDPERRRCTKREVMWESRAGSSCLLLAVAYVWNKWLCNKRGIVVTARVHPGETNASWMMKGLLDYITSSDSVAKVSRSAYCLADNFILVKNGSFLECLWTPT